MGLDAYAYMVPSDRILDERTFYSTCYDEGDFSEDEFFYWRKAYKIQEWMEKLYKRKFPKSDGYFNCIYLHVTNEELDELEEYVKSKEFGTDSESYPEKSDDLEFIKQAREIISEHPDYTVFYYSWW